VWLPGHLADLADLDRAFPTAALLATGYVTAAVGADLPAASGEHRPQAVDYLRRAAREPGFVWTGAAAVDRAAALALGGFGAVRAGEDLVLWVRLALAGTVAWTPRVTAVYVRGTGGIMENLGVPIPARQVASLAQLSAALGAASDALAAGGDEGALRTYINGRVTLAARSALLHGDAPGVERLRSLRVAGPNPDRTVLDRAVDLPPVLLRPTAAAVGAANRVRRRLKATSR
jgi:hypothetical protein